MMTQEKFKELLNELDGSSLNTLIEKNARYSSPNDALHNFREGGEIFGGTSAQACWGYLTKHLVALRDMVQRDDFSNREDFMEKCQDTINYIRFLWCIGNDKPAANEFPKPGSGGLIFDFETFDEANKARSTIMQKLKKFGHISLKEVNDILGFDSIADDSKLGWIDLDADGIIIFEYFDHGSTTATCGLEFPHVRKLI